VTVAGGSTMFAVAGSDGRVHVYDWNYQGDPIEKYIFSYPLVYHVPRLVSISFLHHSQFLVIGSEDESAVVYSLIDNRKIATLKHQGKRELGRTFIY
jgi:hypothetical protein